MITILGKTVLSKGIFGSKGIDVVIESIDNSFTPRMTLSLRDNSIRLSDIKPSIKVKNSTSIMSLQQKPKSFKVSKENLNIKLK